MCRARPVPEELKQTTRKKRRHCVMLRRLASVSRLERNVPPCDTLDLRGGRWGGASFEDKKKMRIQSRWIPFETSYREFPRRCFKTRILLVVRTRVRRYVAFFYKQQINVTVQLLTCEAKRFTQSC